MDWELIKTIIITANSVFKTLSVNSGQIQTSYFLSVTKPYSQTINEVVLTTDQVGYS